MPGSSTRPAKKGKAVRTNIRPASNPRGNSAVRAVTVRVRRDTERVSFTKLKNVVREPTAVAPRLDTDSSGLSQPHDFEDPAVHPAVDVSPDIVDVPPAPKKNGKRNTTGVS